MWLHIRKILEALGQSFVQIDQSRKSQWKENELYADIKGFKLLKTAFDVTISFQTVVSLNVPQELKDDCNDQGNDKEGDNGERYVS